MNNFLVYSPSNPFQKLNLNVQDAKTTFHIVLLQESIVCLVTLMLRHIVKEECTFCPNCSFPAIADMLRRSLEIEPTCPMCGVEMSLDDVREVRV